MANNKKTVHQATSPKVNIVDSGHIPNGVKVVKFQPAKGMVLLDLIPIRESKTENGIIMPETTQKDRVIKCIVIRIPEIEPVYSIGDLVAIMPGSALPFEYNGYVFYLVYETSIQGKYEGIYYDKNENIPFKSDILLLDKPKLVLPLSNVKGEA